MQIRIKSLTNIFLMAFVVPTYASDTQYSVGSLNKPMTGIALARLVDVGKIDLDGPVITYVANPEYTNSFNGGVAENISKKDTNADQCEKARSKKPDETAAILARFESGVIARMERGQDNPVRHTIAARLAHHQVPGAAVAIIRDGEIWAIRGYGTRLAGTEAPIGPDTVFSAGSISKIVNAALILRLVNEGVLDLDADVNDYLQRWHVPASEFTADTPVTLRAIMSHTAGFSVHGFRDYNPGEELPTVIETLNGTGPALNDPVVLEFAPGTGFAYSGGGVTVSQALIEDVTGLGYEQAARRYVFAPLGMTRSTFANPLPASHGDIAHAHDEYGAPAALPRGWEAMPELAASGLWTSANDLARLVIALNDSARGDGAFLPARLAADMMSRVPGSWHGLGPRLNGVGATRVFHHGGANNSYRSWMEGHLDSGDGIVILTNGTDGHWIYTELRKSAADALGWPIHSDGGFEEPEF